MRLPAIKSKRFAVSETHDRSAKRPRVSSDWQVHTSDKVQADHRDRKREQVGLRRATSLSPPQRRLFFKKPRKRGKGEKQGKAGKRERRKKRERKEKRRKPLPDFCRNMAKVVDIRPHTA